MSPHRGACGNCSATTTMALGRQVCCWNPLGCGCPVPGLGVEQPCRCGRAVAAQ